MPRTLLADRIILSPTKHPLPTPGKHRRLVALEGRQIEVFVQREGDEEKEAGLFVLKFGGKGSRAERANSHPADAWPDLPTEVWAVNPPGYGGSPGPANLRHMVAAARAVFEELQGVAAGRPILITGNSLGTATALHLAANYPVSGLILRNPPPLRELIVRRHGWWNLWLPAMAVARQVPRELDSVRNAQASRAPALIMTSALDTIVPPKLQQLVIGSYAGEREILTIENGAHASPIPEHQHAQYLAQLRWLCERVLGSTGPFTARNARRKQ